mmetsp:Transcript_62689/g.198509  ORF Transcript_62689/g.198509 Transcript_62689/m.198509 type:complete len:90 (+) Transcript_62689:86-355(+)
MKGPQHLVLLLKFYIPRAAGSKFKGPQHLVLLLKFYIPRAAGSKFPTSGRRASRNLAAAAQASTSSVSAGTWKSNNRTELSSHPATIRE